MPNNSESNDILIVKTPIVLKAHSKLIILSLFSFLLMLFAAFGFWLIMVNKNQSQLLNILNVRHLFVSLAEQTSTTLKKPSLDSFEKLDTLLVSNNDSLTSILADNIDPEILNENFKIKEIATKVLQQQTILLTLPDINKNLNAEVNGFTQILNDFSSRLAASGAYSGETIRQIDNLIAQAQKISAQVAYLADINYSQSIFAVAELADILVQIEASFNNLIDGVPAEGIQSLKGGADEEVIYEALTIYGALARGLARLVSAAPELAEIQQINADLDDLQQLALEKFNTLINVVYKADAVEYLALKYVSILLAFILMLVFGLLIALWYSFRQKTTILKYEAYTEKERNIRHEQSIFRMIDELEAIGNGDLATELTITDDSTGVVSDCINLTIEHLRDMVGVIKSESLNLNKIIIDTEQIQGNYRDYASQNKVILKSIIIRLQELKDLGAPGLDGQSSEKIEQAFAYLNHDVFNVHELFKEFLMTIDKLQQQMTYLKIHKSTLQDSIDKFKLPVDTTSLKN